MGREGAGYPLPTGHYRSVRGVDLQKDWPKVVPFPAPNVIWNYLHTLAA